MLRISSGLGYSVQAHFIMDLFHIWPYPFLFFMAHISSIPHQVVSGLIRSTPESFRICTSQFRVYSCQIASPSSTSDHIWLHLFLIEMLRICPTSFHLHIKNRNFCFCSKYHLFLIGGIISQREYNLT